MGDLVIVAYRPHSGCEEELLSLAPEHVPYLRTLGLATDRAPILASASNGVVIEVFEWADGAIEKAHSTPEVQRLWARYAEICDYAPLSSLPEAQALFAQFKPVD